jgi:DNA-directed RNA polymerase alpha subunit
VPEEALSLSAEILENTFRLFRIASGISTTPQDAETPANEEKEGHSDIKEEKEELYERILIEQLGLSARPYNCLKTAKVDTVSDLLEYSVSDLMKLNKFGKKSADEVCTVLKARFNTYLKP